MDSKPFAISDVKTGELNALVKNIMKQTGVDDPNEAIRLVNSGEVQFTKPVSPWIEKDGLILFEVTSDGKTGEEWINHFDAKGIKIGDYAKGIIRSSAFKPTNGVVYKVAVMKGELFSDDDRISDKIRKEADKRKLKTPPVELVCLIRDKFSDEEIKKMGFLWIIVFHKPIKDSGGDPILLGAFANDSKPWLNAYHDSPGFRWDRKDGFAFLVSQGKAQN